MKFIATKCKTPGCPNPPAPKRRICTQCRNAQRGQAARRMRYERRNTQARPGSHGCTPGCPSWAACVSGRLWVVGPVPCEGLLDDEIGQEYEAGGVTLAITWDREVRVSV